MQYIWRRKISHPDRNCKKCIIIYFHLRRLWKMCLKTFKKFHKCVLFHFLVLSNYSCPTIFSIASLPHSYPPHSQSPSCCPCPWVLYSCTLTCPFPFFPLLVPPPSVLDMRENGWAKLWKRGSTEHVRRQVKFHFRKHLR